MDIDSSADHYPDNGQISKFGESLTRQLSTALACWFLAVLALSVIFKSWWVLEIYVFPSAVIIWMVKNEDRLKKSKAGLRQLSQNARIHFYFTIPLLVAVRLVLSIAHAVREPDCWRLMLAMSFGLAWCMVLLYAFAMVARKRTTDGG